MTKQEGIREGIIRIITDNGVVFTWDNEMADRLLAYFYSQIESLIEEASRGIVERAV